MRAVIRRTQQGFKGSSWKLSAGSSGVREAGQGGVGEGPAAASHTGSWRAPPGNPPEGYVDPQGWPLPLGQTCAAPWTRHKRELPPSEPPFGFSKTYFSKMYYMCLDILET